jgi:YD repeat-containing protein
VRFAEQAERPLEPPPPEPEPEPDPAPECGINPITLGTGVKIQEEQDYRSANGLRFVRNYNAFGAGKPENGGMTGIGQMGEVWRSHIDKRLYPGLVSAYTAAAMTLPTGSLQYFTPAGEEMLPGLSSNRGQLGSINNGYLYLSDFGVDQFDEAGKLVSTSTVSGWQTRIIHSDGSTGAYVVDRDGNPTAQALPAGMAIRMEDPFGRAISFAYDAYLRLVKMTTPGGSEFLYAYDANHNLTSVRYPDGSIKHYHYGESQYTSGAQLPNALTGITDENGVRYANYSYDAQGRAVGEVYPAAGVNTNRYQLVFGTHQTTVTDPLGTQRRYGFQTVLGVTRSTGTSQPGGAGCGASSSAQSFDANGNIASRTDFNGNVTTYSYDLVRNLETRRTQAAGKPEARTISTQWHGYWRRPVRIARPKRLSFYVYNGDLDPETGSIVSCAPADAVLPRLTGGTQPIGVLCKRIERATTDETGAAGFNAPVTGNVRTWRWTYNRHGQVLSEDGPRTDVADVTTYTYHDVTDPDLGRRGNLATITNALGHVSRITAYDGHGNPLTLVDPNGVETTLAYDARQRLTSRTVDGETTTYTYDNVGQLTRVTLPGGLQLDYTWDGAHRLTDITDSLGNTIHYTLDAIGNRIQEDIQDPHRLLTQTRRREYDALNRLYKSIGAQNQTTQYGYDANGNRTQVIDPLGRTTTSAYDGLHRLIRLTDPGNGVTQYAYDGQNQLIQVTDPRNLVTAYTVDGLGNPSQQISPDTGLTQRSFDAAGNALTVTDAKGQTTVTQYDALDRPVQITYPGGQIRYVWDGGSNGKGRLTRIEELTENTLAGSHQYTWDAQGRLTQETRAIGNISHTQRYAYGNGQLMGMTLASGRQVAYTRNGAGQITRIELTSNAGGPAKVIARDIVYHPFGGVKSWTDGAGQEHTRSQDLDGRINGYSLGATPWLITYDAAGRISEQVDGSDAVNSATYGYDALDRLTGAILPNAAYGYAYDPTGNRTSQIIGGTTRTHTIQGSSNRLTHLTNPVQTLDHDANGSLTDDGTNQYVYDGRGRLVETITVLGKVSYRIDALGRRVRKTVTSYGAVESDTLYHYDLKGHLIGESDGTGQVLRDILWLDDTPLAIVQ